MATTLFLTAAEAHSGTQAAAEIALDVLAESYDRVGVFRAFIDGPAGDDSAFLELAQRAGQSAIEDAYGATRDDYVRSEHEAMNLLVKRFRDFSVAYDAVLVLGMLDGDTLYPGQLSLYGRAAAHLSAPIVLVASAEGRDADTVMTVAHMAAHELYREHSLVQATLMTGARAGLARAFPANALHSTIVLLGVEGSREHAAAVISAVAEHGASVITPIAFTQNLIDQASSRRKSIVLPESSDERILVAAARVLELSVADVILLGEREDIVARAKALGADVSGATFVSMDDAERRERYAVEYARLREKKGVTLEDARAQMDDESYFGVMMVHMGDADGMVSGAVHTTADTLRPAFQVIRTKPGVSIVSSCFLLLLEDRVWVAGDCAVNPNPDAQGLADILSATAQTAQQFGVDPKIALLSYSTGTSGKGPDVDVVAEAAQLARAAHPELAIDGPLQFDAAVDPIVAAQKAPGSVVAGSANVFIFPSLEAGNIGYKLVQRSAGAIAVGPILQGINKPVNDLSRGASVDDIVNTIAITAIQAQEF